MSETIYNRNSFINFDANGNDPLSDKLLCKLQALSTRNTHIVQKMDEYRPDKLAAKLFGDSQLYWVILEFNKLLSFSEITSGRTLKIPDMNELNNLLLISNTQVFTKNIYIK
jgi:hypothetical protein